jgi:hypothetical protein
MTRALRVLRARAVPLALLVLALLAPSRARAAEPRLLASDASGVTLEVDVPEPVISTLESASGRYQNLQFDGFDSDAGIGFPLLPVRTLLVAVPEGARVSASAEGEGERVYDGMRVLPQQDHAWLDLQARSGSKTFTALVENAAAYARVGDGDVPLVRVEGVTGMRAQRVARIVVRPASDDPSIGRVRAWSRVRVSVRFEGGVTRPVSQGRPDPFEEGYKGLVNYESGRAFRRDLGATTLRAKGLVPNAVRTALGTVRQDFTSSPNWLRVEITSKGIYKVDAADFAAAGFPLGSIDPRTIRLFTGKGLPVLEELNPPAGWLSETAISVVGEADGHLDGSDYLLFYGLGSSGWKDEMGAAPPDSDIERYINHPYETKNYYWLTWGGTFTDPPLRWGARSGAPELANAWTAPDFTARLHFEQDLEYVPNEQFGQIRNQTTGVFWEKWAWFTVRTTSGAVPIPFSLPNAVASRPARMRTRLWGWSNESHVINVAINGHALKPRNFFGMITPQDFDTTFADPRATGNQFRIQSGVIGERPDAARPAPVSLFWFDIDYPKTFTPTGNFLDFRSPDTTAAVAYQLGPFTSTTGLQLLDTTDPLAVTRITGYVERDTTGGKAIYFHDDVASRHLYLALTSGNFRRPDAITRVQIDDLKNPANAADYVVITNDLMAGAAGNLASFRSARIAGVANPTARVVKTSDIYAWYSNGRLDPTAIRNFLYDTVRGVGWSQPPTFVCFLGDASFDYKNSLGLVAAGEPTNWVPTYSNAWATAQFATDDWLVDLDLGLSDPYPGGAFPGDSVLWMVPDFASGRLPASSIADADFMVNGKVIPYEAQPSYGEWRRRGLMLADDMTQGFQYDPLGTRHMYESEKITNTLLPLELEPRKFFLIRYPYGSGSEKPAANRDVKAAVNEGMLFWNYIGHGNPFKMADENAFILSDVGALTNIKSPTFLIAASCDLGKFDDAIVTGLGESLLRSRLGGAIATFSATEIAFAFSNEILAENLFSQMFAEDVTGFNTPLGLAAFRAKNRGSQPNQNDNKYVLMGDPAQRLANPNQYIRIALADGETAAPVDSLRRGRRISVHGTVSPTHDPLATDVSASFNGVASVLVVDAAPRDSVNDIFQAKLVYEYDPGVIFHGDVPVTNGQFDAKFIVPLEALTGPNAKVYAYATTGGDDASGAQKRPLTIGSAVVADTTGPTIGLAFLNGLTVVPPDAGLRIVVRDENGINLTGHTIPNALFLTIDGLTRYDLTKDFRYDAGSYQAGSVEFKLPGLDPGPHSITVSAADNYAQGVLGKLNRSTASIDFEVQAAEGFALGRVYNFPNPFKPGGRGTSFVVTGLTEAARVQVKVYSVSGSLVRRLETTGGPGQVQIAWDGRDDRGDRVANGAYLYQVAAEGQSSGQVVRFRGQAAALE